MGDKNLDTSFLHLLINCYTPKNLTKRLTNLTKRLTKT